MALSKLKIVIIASAAVFLLAIIVFVIVILAVSSESLDITEMGLKYSSSSKKVDETQLYDGGKRYWIGPFSSFKKFENQLKPLYFDNTQYSMLTARSNDGMQVSISLGFQYRVRKNLIDLLDLFYSYGEKGFEDSYVRIAKDVLRTAIANFTAFELVYNRTSVESSMKTILQTSLNELHSDIDAFQLLDIVFPSDFSSSISNTQTEELNIQTSLNQQIKTQNDVEGEVLKAQTEAQIIINDAQRDSTTILLDAQGEAIAMDTRINTKLQAYSDLRNSLELTDAGLVAFQWIDTLEKLSGLYKLTLQLDVPKKIQCFHDSTLQGC